MSSNKTDSMTLIMVPLFFQSIFVIFYASLYGFTTDTFKFCFVCTQIAGHKVGFPVSFSLLTLSGVIVGFIISIIVLLFILQITYPTGVRVLGGTVILMLYQLVPLITMYAFLAYVSNILLSQIPDGLGVIPQIFLAIFFIIGVVTNIKAGLD